MSSALLSRFDLVFILLDRPDEQRDRVLSEHVMQMHSGQKGLRKLDIPLESNRDIDNSLSSRLTLTPEDRFEPIPHNLLKKYIAYARNYVHPR
jgi:DNA helicase MCM8